MRNHATSAAVLAADPGATYRAGDPYRAGDARHRDVTPPLADALATPAPNTAGPAPNTAGPAPNTADPEDGGPAKSDALRVATERLEVAARDVVALLADTLPAELSGPQDSTPTAPTLTLRGALAALNHVVAAVNLSQAATVDLVGHLQRHQVAVRQSGITLASWMAAFSRLTFHERRTYQSVGRDLPSMPNVRRAFRDGQVGFGEVRSVMSSTRPLTPQQRAEVDAEFGDLARLEATSSDDLIDQVRRRADRLNSRKADERRLRQIEGRFLAVTPQLDGALTLYGEFDAEAGATLLGALEAAMPPPVPREEHGRGALAEHESGALSDGGREALPAIDRDRGDWSSRGRQRADAMLSLAEAYLADPGPAPAAGSAPRTAASRRRARPRMQIVADLATLAGDATPARLLWDAAAPPVTLTAAATRRLASDATWQFILVDRGRVLGVSEPTSNIPSNVRQAVAARDQGCRFPGCHAPMRWCDLHHVVPRERQGPTTVDNLVALCRRHHTAVTESTWKLDMASDGSVAVRRGRRRARSVPPGAWRPPDPG